MIVRLKITLEQEEYSALVRMAMDNLRAVPEEARFIIRKELEQSGLLKFVAIHNQEPQNNQSKEE